MRVAARPLAGSAQPGLRTLMARGASAAFLVQVCGAGAIYLSQIVFARWLGVGDYGAFAFALSLALILTRPGELGLATGVVRFIPQYLAHQDWARLRGIVSRCRQLAFLAGVIIAILGTVVLQVWQPERIGANTLIVGMWLVPLLAFMNLQAEMIRSTQRMVLAYLPSLVVQPLLAVGVGFIFLLTTHSVTSLSALVAVALATLVVLGIQALGVRNSLPRIAATAAPSYATREWLSVSFPLMLVGGFSLVLRRADILMVGIIMGPREAGVYDAASKTAWLVGFVLVGVTAIAAPMIASFHARGDYPSLQRVVRTAVTWMFWPSLVMVLALTFLGGTILGVFGADFRVGQWALRILLVGQLVNASVGSVGYLMVLTGHQKVVARVFGVTALVNVTANAALIPLAGIAGAALATSASLVLLNVWLYRLASKYLGIRSFVFARS